MFQGFKTNIDYTDYLSEGDVVCIYGTVGEEQELFGMRWTEISDSAVIACGDACEEYAQDSSDEAWKSIFMILTRRILNLHLVNCLNQNSRRNVKHILMKTF